MPNPACPSFSPICVQSTACRTFLLPSRPCASSPFFIPTVFRLSRLPGKARLLHPPLSSISNTVWISVPAPQNLLERGLSSPRRHMIRRRADSAMKIWRMGTPDKPQRRRRTLISFPNGHLVSGVQGTDWVPIARILHTLSWVIGFCRLSLCRRAGCDCLYSPAKIVYITITKP